MSTSTHALIDVSVTSSRNGAFPFARLGTCQRNIRLPRLLYASGSRRIQAWPEIGCAIISRLLLYLALRPVTLIQFP